MRIRCVRITMAALAVATAPTWSQEGQGLDPSASGWPSGQWHARIELSPGSIPSNLTNPYNIASQYHGMQQPGLSVLGDFFFNSHGASRASPADFSGFRATSGLMLGPRSLGGVAAPGALYDGKSGDSGPVPYFGLGYTGLPAREGWGFSADFGLMALSPRSAVKFGGVLGGPQNIEDLLRDLRLSPLLRLGVSYSF